MSIHTKPLIVLIFLLILARVKRDAISQIKHLSMTLAAEIDSHGTSGLSIYYNLKSFQCKNLYIFNSIGAQFKSLIANQDDHSHSLNAVLNTSFAYRIVNSHSVYAILALQFSSAMFTMGTECVREEHDLAHFRKYASIELGVGWYKKYLYSAILQLNILANNPDIISDKFEEINNEDALIPLGIGIKLKISF